MSRKKEFVKADLCVPEPPAESPAEPDLAYSTNAIVNFKGAKLRSFDFSPWYGCAIDSITEACQRQIERFLAGLDSEVEHSTVITYCQAGMRFLLEYTLLRAAALKRELTLRDINRDFIDGYLGSLDSHPVEDTTRKSRYVNAKSVLKALCHRGLITETFDGDNATFPRNPFPGVHKHQRGAKRLSAAERKQFSAAVKQAVMPLFREDVEPTSYLLACALLVIALHTGRNTTPLLEMRIDCLRPHPKTGVKFLVVFKRRGHKESKVALRAPQISKDDLEMLATVRPTVADLVQRIIDLSARLRPEASNNIRDSIWLFRTRSSGRGTAEIGTVSALNDKTLGRAIGELVKNFGLVDTDGNPLKISVSRLRKTFINNIFELLDGDFIATAAAAGNTPQILVKDYLRPTDESERNWLFMGQALTQELLTSTVGSHERTPVARCSNPKDGEYAPKRQNLICTSFLNCLRCRNLVVTGDDLYRLFSFYWRVLKERTRMNARHWKRHLAHIIRLIDRDVIAAGVAKGIFKQEDVNEQRSHAFSNPHPFWRADVALTELESLGVI